jgi:hypothetical protein
MSRSLAENYVGLPLDFGDALGLPTSS